MADACCPSDMPVAVAHDHDKGYEQKGQWAHMNGITPSIRTYISGPENATKGIFFVYDVFGYSDQTLQGADTLAAAGYKVVMPDFFNYDYARDHWFPQDTEEKKAARERFSATSADIPTAVSKVHPMIAELRAQYPDIKEWDAIGYCWGGKIVALTSGADTPFAAAVLTSPSRMTGADASNVTIPMAVLASKGEPAEGVEAYRQNLKVRKHVEVFESQVHGWMSARADLKDDKVRGEYERGYKVALNFLAGGN